MLRMIVVALLLFTAPVLAQTQTQSLTKPATGDAPDDLPRGFPYNTGSYSADTGRMSAGTQVPLRDYLSSRIDSMEQQFLRLLEERDRQYAQRFEAQQKALADALQASKETGAKELQATKDQAANALAASEKAISKAEEASNKRFDSVNEFRQTLDDQAEKFITKDTVQAQYVGIDLRFKSVEEKVSEVVKRLDAITSQSKGAGELWGWIVGVIGIIGLIITITINATRVRPLVK